MNIKKVTMKEHQAAKRKVPGKDPRYEVLLDVWKAGNLKTLDMIFDVVPRSVVAGDVGITYSTFLFRLSRPDQFIFGNIEDLAEVTGIDMRALAILVCDAILKKKGVPSDYEHYE